MTIEDNALAARFQSAVLQLMESPEMVEDKAECISLQDRSVEQRPQDPLCAMFEAYTEGLARLIPRVFPDLDRRGDTRQ